jgi:hypothetical protein
MIDFQENNGLQSGVGLGIEDVERAPKGQT